MKYGSTASVAGTSNSNAQQHQQQYEQSVISAASGQTMFTMDGGQSQSSVIKTAPPGRANTQQQQQMLMDFSPKQEPIDLAPLTSGHPCLQDLGKMSVGGTQLEHYYSSMNAVSSSQAKAAAAYSASPYYEYLNVGSAAAYHPGQGPSALLQPNAAATVVALGNGVQHQDWPYMSYTSTAHHQQQQQQLGSYLGQLDSCNAAQLGLDQQHQRLYKNGVENGNDGGVDSGIGQELLLEQAKQQLHDFFGPVSLSSAAMLIPSQSQSSVIHQHHAQELQQQQQASASSSSLHSQQQQRQRNSVDEQQHRNNGVSNNNGGSTETQLNFPSDQSQRAHEQREQSISVIIPKLDNLLGFQYTLEAPISTSIRKDDDRMTYVNKGQYYTISFDYLPDMRYPLKGPTVRSQVMVVFREDKSYDEELRTWMVWYKRQHSPKQRIIEIDAKNSMGAIGGEFMEMAAHNAVQFNWNPAEQPGPKVSIAVQCLSTDFSTQKGVKGLPLHIQIDTYDDQADSKIPFHRGYCQIKVFCDKGAERKLRDEDKRANRRKSTTGGGTTAASSPQSMASQQNGTQTSGSGTRKKAEGEFHEPCERSQFYHSADLERPAALFIPSEEYFFDTASIGSYDALSELEPQPKRPRPSERIMIYVRKPNEEIFTPLHLVPPTLCGLARAISEKYNLDESKIEAFYKQCQKGGVIVKIDDDMLRHYSNQDTFLLELKQSELNRHIFYSVTLVELHSANNTIGVHQSQTPSATSSSSTTSETAPPTGSMVNLTNGHQSNGLVGTQSQQQQQHRAAVW